MIDPVQLQMAVVTALREAGLFVDRYSFDRSYAAVQTAGENQKDRLVEVYGKHAWKLLMAQTRFADAEATCQRMLGFGYHITRFMVAPLGLAKESNHSIAELGALCNLIVALQDHFVDTGIIKRRVVFSLLLRAALSGKDTGLMRVLGRLSTRKTRLMMRLIHQYLSGIERLSASSQTDVIRHTLIHAINKMYRANNALIKSGAADQLYWPLLRKSALPFVVMGLPAWFTIESWNTSRYLSHLRWMYGLGEFFAWIDDVSDLYEDIQAGQANLVTHALMSVVSDNDSIHALAQRIAGKGRKLLQYYNVLSDTKVDSALTNIVQVCVIDWLGEYDQLLTPDTMRVRKSMSEGDIC